MESSLCSDPAVLQAILFIFLCFPLLSYFLLSIVRFALDRLWTEYVNASKLKQEKSARNLTKAIVYFIIWCLLLPISIRLLSEWRRNGFNGYIPPFSVSYVQIVLSLVFPLYVFELVTSPERSAFEWLHHGVLSIVAPFIIAGSYFDTSEDLFYLLYTSVLMIQAAFLAFVFFAGHAVARIWQESRRKYRLLNGIAWFDMVNGFAMQLFIWLRFAGNLDRLSNWKPILMTVIVSLALATENAHGWWKTFSMAKYVRKRVEERIKDKASEESDKYFDHGSNMFGGSDSA